MKSAVGMTISVSIREFSDYFAVDVNPIDVNIWFILIV